MQEMSTFPLPGKDHSALRVGLTYNLKKGIASEVEDIEAEYDSMDTVLAIRDVFASAGIETVLLEADALLVENLKASHVDIVFNIAEGMNGRGREGQIPALLNYFNIPFTGSDETTLCMALDKSLTKRYVGTFGVRSPRSQVIGDMDYVLDHRMLFPLIIKPNSEGSSKGISDLAIVNDAEQLRRLVSRNLGSYKQPMLAEEYIAGREFTVGIFGNGSDARVFDPMEICFLDGSREKQIYSFDVKKNYKKYIAYKCPPDLEPDKIQEMKAIAANVFGALECRDFARMDFRMDTRGNIYFIEINPLPGLAPGYSDYPMLAAFCGMEYNDLVLGVLKNALKRLHITKGGFIS
jgi:D-alanine-D-alanine ligase